MLPTATNYFVVTLMMERFPRGFPAHFIQAAFPRAKDDPHLHDELFNLYVNRALQNVWDFFLLLDHGNQMDLHKYLDSLVPQEERETMMTKLKQADEFFNSMINQEES